MLIFPKSFHAFHERSYANRAIIGHTTQIAFAAYFRAVQFQNPSMHSS